MKLTNEDKELLAIWGNTKEHIAQIEEALNKSTYVLMKAENNNSMRKITAKDAIKLLGKKEFLSGLDRSAFHFTSVREIPDTEGQYVVNFDSHVLFGYEAYKVKNDPNLYVEEVEYLQEYVRKYPLPIRVKEGLYNNDDIQEMLDSLKNPKHFKGLDFKDVSDSDKRAILRVIEDGYYETFDRYDSDVCEQFIRVYNEYSENFYKEYDQKEQELDALLALENDDYER